VHPNSSVLGTPTSSLYEEMGGDEINLIRSLIASYFSIVQETTRQNFRICKALLHSAYTSSWPAFPRACRYRHYRTIQVLSRIMGCNEWVKNRVSKCCFLKDRRDILADLCLDISLILFPIIDRKKKSRSFLVVALRSCWHQRVQLKIWFKLPLL
jgi:hypothetical protein